MIRFTGIDCQSLGHYFEALGLLAAVSSQWEGARGWWHEGTFVLAGVSSRAEVIDFLIGEWKPTPYLRWWAVDQKADTKAKSSVRLWRSRSTRCLKDVRIADATLVPGSRTQFNPIFGTGGNIGKRDLQVAWTRAFELIQQPESLAWLGSTLFGTPSELPDFANAGTWFVYNNKAFNSGQSWYREGFLSPWSFLLACEGSLLLRGNSSRRLSARARPYAVFPFISQASDADTSDDLRSNRKGEFWAPLWEMPATLGEVRGLFQRGLARIGGRPATAPHEFAVAALSAGAEAGVSEFVRFELRQTTSSQVFEALPRQVFKIHSREHSSDSPSKLLSPLLGRHWFETLPKESGGRQSGKFYGLRAPLEERILDVGQEPDNPEVWQKLFFALSDTQLKVDRNISVRGSHVKTLPLLPKEWLSRCFPFLTRNPEIRLAASLASLGAGSNYPAQCNVYGVDVKVSGNQARTSFVETGRPARVVWQEGNSESAFLDLVQRRLLDSDVENSSNWPLVGYFRPLVSDIELFLAVTDEGSCFSIETMQRWFPALTLIGWAPPKKESNGFERATDGFSPEVLLWAFFKPFFFQEDIALETAPNRKVLRKLTRGASNPLVARRLFHCLRREAWDEALQTAVVGYEQQNVRMIPPITPIGMSARRLAVALAFPTSIRTLLPLLERWMEPLKQSASQG